MTKVAVFALIAGLVIVPSVWADEHGPWDFEFTYVHDGALIPDYGLGIGVYPLTMDPQVEIIAGLELEITDLWHESPWDLDIYLINPYGAHIDVMTDLGDQHAIAAGDPVTLFFNDKGQGRPGGVSGDDQLVSNTSGTPYLPEGLYLGEDGGMHTFFGGPDPPAGGTDAWVLIMIDDDREAQGSFDSYTLRGIVPEPMTLSLLALGAVAITRRRRG